MSGVGPLPVVAGLFSFDGDQIRLMGVRCAGCDTVYFPAAIACRNPDCHAGHLEKEILPRSGRIVSYTVQRYQPPAMFRTDAWAPYVLALVDLGDGVEVMGILREVDPDNVEIGIQVEVVAHPLYRDPERGEVITYAFAPVSEGQAA